MNEGRVREDGKELRKLLPNPQGKLVTLIDEAFVLLRKEVSGEDLTPYEASELAIYLKPMLQLRTMLMSVGTAMSWRTFKTDCACRAKGADFCADCTLAWRKATGNERSRRSSLTDQ